MVFAIMSLAIRAGAAIARQYTCDGRDVSPPLSWENPPQETQSFALICEDPDAPMGTWVHWVVYNIPAILRALPEGLPAVQKLQDGTLQGKNDFGRLGYGGPCPPVGRPHRYFFRLYALAGKPNLEPGAKKQELLRAMEGRILGQAEFFATYGRK